LQALLQVKAKVSGSVSLRDSETAMARVSGSPRGTDSATEKARESESVSLMEMVTVLA
jgi:hypothetical protein